MSCDDVAVVRVRVWSCSSVSIRVTLLCAGVLLRGGSARHLISVVRARCSRCRFPILEVSHRCAARVNSQTINVSVRVERRFLFTVADMRNALLACCQLSLVCICGRSGVRGVNEVLGGC